MGDGRILNIISAEDEEVLLAPANPLRNTTFARNFVPDGK
jgi:hypothetical protein